MNTRCAFCLVVLLFLAATQARKSVWTTLSLVDEAVVQLSIHASSDLKNAVALPLNEVPALSGIRGGTMFNVVRVADGKKCKYEGIIRKVDASKTVNIEPGKSVSYKIDLKNLYVFPTAGEYSIQFVGREIKSARFTGYLGPDADSKPLHFKLAQPSYPPSPPVTNIAVPTETTETRDMSYTLFGCDQNEADMVDFPLEYLHTAAQLVSTETAYPSFYTTYFGTYSSSSWAQVNGHYESVLDFLDTKDFIPNCGGSECSANTYAYVYPSDTSHNIYLCNVYFLSDTTFGGQDTCPGTLLHEILHFSDVVGTYDYAYGVDDCQELAITDPAEARMNSDSHQYYMETHYYASSCLESSSCDTCTGTNCGWCWDDLGYGLCVPGSSVPAYGTCPVWDDCSESTMISVMVSSVAIISVIAALL